MPEYAPLEAILRLCAASAPVPWYPRNAAPGGIVDPELIALVEQLRGGGLVARTDAVPGLGRGYVLTPLGVQALQDLGALEWLRRGEIPPQKVPRADDDPTAGAAAVSERERAVRQSLLAPSAPRVTQVLIALNVAVFLWGIYLGRKQGIPLSAFVQLTNRPDVIDIAHRTGSIQATDVLAPGWGYFRLLTCCFVHFGLIHIGANMLSLYWIGPMLERMWGRVRFLVLYLVAGLAGSCAAMVLHPVNEQGVVVPMAGASGAIWGIMVSMGVWFLLNRRYLPQRMFWSAGRQILFVILLNVGITYAGSGFISAEAHYGGGIVGAVCAVLLHFTRFAPAALRAAAAAAVALLPAFGLWAVAHPARFNPQWATLVKVLQQRKEADEKRQDTRDMQDRVMPQVKEMEKKALQHVPDALADPVINQNPERRNEELTKRTIQAYGEAQAALAPALDLLRQAGPYGDADVEKARQVRLQLVEARLDVFARNKRCLEAGKDWSRQDEEKREEAIKKVRNLENEWFKLLR